MICIGGTMKRATFATTFIPGPGNNILSQIGQANIVAGNPGCDASTGQNVSVGAVGGNLRTGWICSFQTLEPVTTTTSDRA